MTAFTIGAACLVLIAVLMLLPAWRPGPVAGTARPAHLNILAEQLAALDREHAAGQLDAQQHARARNELQRRMLDESTSDGEVHEQAVGDAPRTRADDAPRTLAIVGLAVPLFAVALYAAVGNPAGLKAQPARTGAQVASNANVNVNPEVSPEAVQAMLATLAERLERPSANPAVDLQGWTMLARSYAALQRFADAERAYARAITFAPDDAQLLADRADVLAVLQGQSTVGEPDRLIAKALQIDPNNLKALALAGNAAFERKAFAVARDHWQQARRIAADGSPFAAGLDNSLIAVREAMGETITVPAAAQTARVTAAAPATTSATTAAVTLATAASAPDPAGPGAIARITGRVSLAPALAAKVAATDTVFVFARAAEGSRMPLAIVRRTAADLPFDFTLDDSQAMSAQTKLSSAQRVVVSARISRSGSAVPQPGDLRGESAAIGTRSEGVALSINASQP